MGIQVYLESISEHGFWIITRMFSSTCCVSSSYTPVYQVIMMDIRIIWGFVKRTLYQSWKTGLQLWNCVCWVSLPAQSRQSLHLFIFISSPTQQKLTLNHHQDPVSSNTPPFHRWCWLSIRLFYTENWGGKGFGIQLFPSCNHAIRPNRLSVKLGEECIRGPQGPTQHWQKYKYVQLFYTFIQAI